MNHRNNKLLIFIISYKASHRLRDVFNKIPFKKLKKYNIEILISDDCSKDNSILYAKKIKKKNLNKKIFINENKKNLGYGSHIKKCLDFALKRKNNYAVMIHGDGQYDPKYIPSLMKKFEENENIGASTGSRIFNGIKNAILGGMPFYKLLGNVILTKIFNLIANKNYTDTHTGLWVYNLKYLKSKNYRRLTDSFNFDQDFRIMSIANKRLIKEIPIKTRYGDERSQMHIGYAIKFFFISLIFFLIKIKILKSKKY